MIAANVAAAQALEAKRTVCMYRVHEAPPREKLVALKDYLETFGIAFALGQVVAPKTFNALLAKVKGATFAQQVSEQVLRTQTQAYYSPENKGHFGLALRSYGHFTSPIRRYADLMVHRALVRAYKLGDDGLSDAEVALMPRTAEHISMTERRAMEAERENGRPLCRRLSVNPRRRDDADADHRRSQVRLLRHGRGRRRRRAGPGVDARGRIFRV